MTRSTSRGVLFAAGVILAALALAATHRPDGATAARGAVPDSLLAPTPGDQRNPAVASDGAGFFVAWEDGRDGVFDRHLYGARVAADGTTLDPDGILIADQSGGQYLPSVAFDGVNYLVVWMPGVLGPIRGARVSPDGTVLDPGGFAIATSAGEPRVTFDGTNYLVVYEGANFSIRATRVTPAGEILDPSGFSITSADSSDTRASASFGSGEYLVTWDRLGDVYGARVTPDGAVLDPGGFPISTVDPDGFNHPVSVFNGTDFVVTWEDRRTDQGRWHIYAARVTPSAVVRDPSGIPIE